jgi:hypothetical protein
VAWSRCCDTRGRKSESTGNTNFDLNRRASLRPYLREAGGESPSAHSPGVAMTLFGLAALLAPVVGSTLLSLTLAGRILRRRP